MAAAQSGLRQVSAVCLSRHSEMADLTSRLGTRIVSCSGWLVMGDTCLRGGGRTRGWRLGAVSRTVSHTASAQGRARCSRCEAVQAGVEWSPGSPHRAERCSHVSISVRSYVWPSAATTCAGAHSGSTFPSQQAHLLTRKRCQGRVSSHAGGLVRRRHHPRRGLTGSRMTC